MTPANESGIARIRAAFRSASESGRTALLPFVTGGFPNPTITEELLRALPGVGADLIEVGFPFSDPIADGPVIADSMHRALVSGVTPSQVFDAISRAKSTAPVIAMVSVSIVGRMGRQHFIDQAVASGVSGFIVPDADPREAASISEAAAARGAGFCALIAPTTPVARAGELARISTGFVYLLARAGVTGERSEAPDVSDRVSRLRDQIDAPIAVGFGISTAQHVRAVGEHADGAIVGSALVRAMLDAVDTGSDPVAAVLNAVGSLR